ncbi:MAG: hypothetical protein JNK11_15330 [Alphaproteobacteria bacterium]|nr:hypothetical protein [Alphaproteobacteria bacterium]
MALLAAAAAHLWPGQGEAQTADLADGRTGRIEFASVTPLGALTIPRRLSGGMTPATAVGTLTLPKGAAASLPAMVIAHGSGGAREGDLDWAKRVNAMGAAAMPMGTSRRADAA